MTRQTRQPAAGIGRPAAPSAVEAALTRLRAVRRYADVPVGDELVAGWLEAARWCGSSRNSQPWRFIVVRDPALRTQLARLGDHASHLAEAPVVVVVAAVDGPFPFSTVFDLGRVAQSLMLAAHADGVGSCIAVFGPPENMDRARALLGVPAEVRVDLAIGFGVPAVGTAPTEPTGDRPSPPGRRPLEDLVSWERYGAADVRS